MTSCITYAAKIFLYKIPDAQNELPGLIFVFGLLERHSKCFSSSIYRIRPSPVIKAHFSWALPSLPNIYSNKPKGESISQLKQTTMEASSSEMEFTEIETNADSIDNSVIFHVIKSVFGFVLYMHQQIPS